jgi:hypothetical protein
MPRFEQGYKKSVETILSGIIIAAVIRSFLAVYNIEYLIILFDIISIISILFLFEKMKYWGIGYTIGWIIGILLFVSILSIWEVILYLIIFVVTLVIKFTNKIQRLLSK